MFRIWLCSGSDIYIYSGFHICSRSDRCLRSDRCSGSDVCSGSEIEITFSGYWDLWNGNTPRYPVEGWQKVFFGGTQGVKERADNKLFSVRYIACPDWMKMQCTFFIPFHLSFMSSHFFSPKWMTFRYLSYMYTHG